MEARPRDLLFYETEDDIAPCRDWLAQMEASKSKAYGIILHRLDRVENGNFGVCRYVDEGVYELVVDFGPGYRVYFGQDGDSVILLLGGTKRTQVQDIKKAREYWSDYNA